MAHPYLSEWSEEASGSLKRKSGSPKRQRKDPIHKPENADISSYPSEDGSDDWVPIPLSIRQHEERLQKKIEEEMEKNKWRQEKKEIKAEKEQRQKSRKAENEE